MSDDDLSGFSDLIKNKNNKNKKRAQRHLDGYENLTFLEHESERLNKLIDLFEYKISNLRDYPQDIALSVQQETLNFELRELLINDCLDKNSPFETKMDVFVKSFFS